MLSARSESRGPVYICSTLVRALSKGDLMWSTHIVVNPKIDR